MLFLRRKPNRMRKLSNLKTSSAESDESKTSRVDASLKKELKSFLKNEYQFSDVNEKINF